jgi:hypothetical protein
MSESMFVQAVYLARSGKKSEARDLFQQVLALDRSNEMAWLWYAECADTQAERVQILETCARLNPQAQRVRLSLSSLQNGNPPADDLGMTQPVIIRSGEPAHEEKESPSSFSQEDAWVLSADSNVFTIPPERVPQDAFARIEESTEAFLINNPDMKPIFKRPEDWSEINARPTAVREPRSRPRPAVIPDTGFIRSDPKHDKISAIFAFLLVTMVFVLLASAAILLHAV